MELGAFIVAPVLPSKKCTAVVHGQSKWSCSSDGKPPTPRRFMRRPRQLLEATSENLRRILVIAGAAVAGVTCVPCRSLASCTLPESTLHPVSLSSSVTKIERASGSSSSHVPLLVESHKSQTSEDANNSPSVRKTGDSVTSAACEMVAVPQSRGVENVVRGEVNAVIRRVPRPRLSVKTLHARIPTIALVAVGSYQSGATLFRSVFSRDSDSEGGRAYRGRSSSGWTGAGGELYTVTHVQLPFSVKQCPKLTKRLAAIAVYADLSTANSMASSACDVAEALLSSDKLFDGTSNLCACIETYETEALDAAEHRFKGHVNIEKRRRTCLLNDLKCKNENRANGSSSSGTDTESTDNGVASRRFGIVTLVVASARGVDLGCYNLTSERESIRDFLQKLRFVQGGDILGLELTWLPDETSSHGLTLSDIRQRFAILTD